MYPFVGREDVLGELRAALARAVRGRGGLVTPAGAAGAAGTGLGSGGAPGAGPGDGELYPEGGTGEVVDGIVRAAYRRRLRELEGAAGEADAAGDAGRSERIAVARDALVGRPSAA